MIRIATYIGGTTAKCALITGGQVKLDTNYLLHHSDVSAGYPVIIEEADTTVAIPPAMSCTVDGWGNAPPGSPHDPKEMD